MEGGAHGGCICVTMDTRRELVNLLWVHPVTAAIYQTLPVSPGTVEPIRVSVTVK